MEKMTLPTFLGIGAQRSGTTWLYNVLKSHPDLDVPNKVKEIHFFDKHYDKGVSWYESFFDDAFEEHGEVTPKYLYDERVPERASETLSNPKFIVILREPSERAASHYKNAYLHGKTRANNLSTYLEEEPSCFARGLYHEQLQRWFEHFEREKFHIFIFERIMADKRKALAQLSQFLEVDRQGFELPGEKVNSSFNPVFHSLYKKGLKLHNYLQRKELYSLASFLEKGGILFRRFGQSKNQIPDQQMHNLKKEYKNSVQQLNELLDADIMDVWGGY